MPPRRLQAGPSEGAPVRFRWDGATLEGRAGEPLAVALLAAGRRTISRSFRFHRPRGLMCASGTCGWCECEVDGRPGTRACRVSIAAGLEAHGEHAWPSVSTDLLGLLDLANRAITPGFYHHRFLRPFRLRKRYLDVIRAFGGRGTVRPGPREDSPAREVTVAADVVVVGAGPAGLTAALAASDAGARVVVVEADPEPGGSGRWLRNEPGAGVSGSGDPGAIGELVGRARAALGERLLLGTAGLAREGSLLRCVAEGALITVDAPVVIAATGSRERPPLVPGNDRPGVVGARAAAWLVNRWRVTPGDKAVLLDDGPDADAAAAVLSAAGIAVVTRVPEADLLAVLGTRGVRGVRLRHGSRTREVAADLLIFSRRAPSLELPLLAGAATRRTGGGITPILDDDGRTTVPGLFVAGSATGLDLGPDAELARARLVGARAAQAAGAVLSGGDPAGRSSPDASTIAAFASDRPEHPAAFLCFCEDVRVRDVTREQAHGYEHPEFLKRRTGALTGPCQGRFCLDRFVGVCDAGATAWGEPGVADPGELAALPAARPPLRTVRLGALVTEDDPR